MESFGTVLAALLQDHGVSVTELSKRMGMRSKTTLQRILRDQSTHATVQRFWEQLRASEMLPLSGSDVLRLEELLEILRVGPDAYRTHRALRQLLHVHDSVHDPIAIHGLPGIDTFDELTRRLADSDDISITIIGLCDVRIFQSLRDMINRMPPHRHPRIDHSIFRIDGASETIRNVHAIFPILFYRNYTANMVPLLSDDCERCFPGEMLLCRYTDKNGMPRHLQLSPASPSCLHAIQYPDSAAYDYWLSLIHACATDLIPLKSDFGDAQSRGDYVAYTENIRQLELRSNVYIIKPDIPINFVPPQILLQAVTSGDSAPFLPPEQQALIEPLFLCHEQRYQHIFHRRKVTHIILSPSFMEEFAKTGRKTDHFFGARPYTPQERAAILSNCLEHSMNNPYFSVHFSRDEQLIRHAEVCCYEGKGTILVNAHTSYDLSGDHAEALITHDGFNRQFRDYYVNELLRHHVLPAAEGHAFLRGLIDLALRSN